MIAAAEAHSQNQCGSTNGVGSDFQPFRINDLEMADQNSASWNRIAGWLRQLDLVRSAA